MDKKLFSTIALFIICIVTIASGYLILKNSNIPDTYTFLSLPDKNKMVRWKTYENGELGFEFKYPPDLEVIKQDYINDFLEGHPEYIFFVTNAERKQNAENIYILGPWSKDLYTIEKLLSLNFLESQYTDIKKRSILVDGRVSFELELGEEVTGIPRFIKMVFVDGNEGIWDIRVYTNEKNRENDFLIFDQFLSTFSFRDRNE